MKLVNNNISPLPFYSDISLQNHRKDYAFGQIYPLIVRGNVLLPFQVILSTDVGDIRYVRLYDFNAGKYEDITSDIKDAGLILQAYSEFIVLKYYGIYPLNKIKYSGRYYLEIKFTNSTIYSDIFTVTFSNSDYLLVEYSNSYNLELKNGIVDFSDNFKFRCYLDTQVGKPEYDFEEESTERLGYTFIESQVSKKLYKFTFLAPEYLCDALRIIRLCDNKKITCKSQTYDLTTFSMDVEWQDQGDLASVECEFETDTVIANIGGYAPKPLGGDFNNDFNNDFKTS